jgi:uncharacterized membrane protein
MRQSFGSVLLFLLCCPLAVVLTVPRVIMLVWVVGAFALTIALPLLIPAVRPFVVACGCLLCTAAASALYLYRHLRGIPLW